MADTPQPRTRTRSRAGHITDSPDRDPSKGGRSSRLDDKKMMKVLEDALVSGNTYANACIMAGLGESTFHRWMQEGADAPEGHPLWEFRERMRKAAATAEHRNLMIIQKAAVRQWGAAAWFLERRNPAQYGRREVVTVGGDGTGQPILTGQVSEKALTDEGTMAALAAVLRRRAPQYLGQPATPTQAATP